jgi:prolyl-tRNA editing enzyme YbaK/EbsC (Cys-tRNA(Pro) deacylase)
MQPQTPEDVQRALDRLVPGTRIRFFETSTATSQQAADSVGCELGQIVKSICFIVGGAQPVIVLTSGDQRVDERKLAALLHVGRKQVKTAAADECVTVFGYPPGSVPPLAHRAENIIYYIDASLRRFEQLYAAGGAPNAIFPITLEALARATGGQIVDVVRTDSPFSGNEQGK